MPGYILSDIEPDSDFYVAVGFSLPYCLHLPDGKYTVLLQSDKGPYRVQIRLEQKHKSHQPKERTPRFVEAGIDANQRGICHYSYVIAYVPVLKFNVGLEDDIDTIGQDIIDDHTIFLALAIEAIRQLTEIYRFCTKECHIKPLAGYDVWFDHTIVFIPIKQPERSYYIPIYNLINVRNVKPEIPVEIVDDIRNKIRSGYRTKLAEELLMNAYDLLERGVRRMAVIEAETAFEAAILDFLSDVYKDRPDKITKIYNQKSFTNILNMSDFRNAIKSKSKDKDFEKGESPRKEWERYVWELRGALVHGRIADVSNEEAAKAIQTVEETLEYLLDREKTKPWRYS